MAIFHTILHECVENYGSQNAFSIGIGGVVTHSPLPHHRTCGSAYGGSIS